MSNMGYLIIAPDNIAYHSDELQKITYKTTPDTACSKKNQNIYKYVTKFRTMETNALVNYMKTFTSDIVLLGVSEGAIAVSKCNVPVKAKIVCQYHMKSSYLSQNFTLEKDKHTKVLQIIGELDEFFSRNKKSVHELTKNACGGKSIKRKLKGVQTYIVPNGGHSLMTHPLQRKEVCNVLQQFAKSLI